MLTIARLTAAWNAIYTVIILPWVFLCRAAFTFTRQESGL